MTCPFCALEESAFLLATDTVVAIRDLHPVSPGHTLVLPRRHVVTYFDATWEEQQAIWQTVAEVKRRLDAESSPDGYNVGFNAGEAAGQTVPHLHVHVIPRYRGDVEDPRGGVRGVVAGKAHYAGMPDPLAVRELFGASEGADSFGIAPHHRALVSGAETDPLLPHLRAHLDRATSLDMVVAFVLPSGVLALETKLTDMLERGGRLRVLTGDYLDATDPEALVRLVDLADRYPGKVQLRVYEARQRSFHPKAYVVRTVEGTGIAFVGSSNLSRTALAEGVEWNYRVVSTSDHVGFHAVATEVERLWCDPSVKVLTPDWIARYRERRPTPYSTLPTRVVGLADHHADLVDGPVGLPHPEILEPCTPTDIQKEALQALAASRREGNRAGLVVLATGLGKTFLSAFDAQAMDAKRILFVAHREEILRQAHRTFRSVMPHASLGFYVGDERVPDADVVFASVQTLSRRAHLERFARDAFDYITVDEFHHADAPTYRRLLEHFEPQFLLGLTATPERTDGGDLLALCGENLVYRADLFDGIQRGRLSRFHYFGVPDEVEYENIPWRSGRFDPDSLTQAVATETRAANALAQLRLRGGKRTLAFCVSVRHADFMRDYLTARGYRAATVHSGAESMPRGEAIDRLRLGKLDVVLSVDMFNEGVDIPSVDTVLMLRPTESRSLWLQQIGRGLRLSPGKDLLRIIDYVGNHRSFLGPLELLFSGHGDQVDILRKLAELRSNQGQGELPAGCQVTYDLEAIEILERLRRGTKSEVELREWVHEVMSRSGRRPTATEAFHAGHRPDKLPKKYGTWLGAMGTLGALTNEEAAVLGDSSCARYLEHLSAVSMQSAGPMVAQLAWVTLGQFPSAVDERSLADGFIRLARRLGPMALGFGDRLEEALGATDLVRQMAGDTWTQAGVRYDVLQKKMGSWGLSFPVPDPMRAAFAELVREIAEWRISEFLARTRRDRNAAVFVDDGRELDAHFSTDLTEHGYQIVLESRGGAKGSPAERNTEYGVGLEQILLRLSQLDARLDGAWLATRESQNALELTGFEYPVLLGRADPKAVRTALQRAQGNNPTRRIRLVVSGLAEMTPTKLHRLLSRGPAEA